jgi:hypothetical protein
MNIRDLISLFFSCCKYFVEIYVLFEAIDECADFGLRWKLSTFCEEALRMGPTHRILVSSRPHLSMELLKDAVSLHIRTDTADLEKYIRENLRYMGSRFSPALREEITRALLQHADGWY